MKKLILYLIPFAFVFNSCSNSTEESTSATEGQVTEEQTAKPSGLASVDDPNSTPTVVKIAVGSKDHTTLVTALSTAGLVEALSNSGPFTVFAPINSAFDALPAGTLDNLMKPESKDALTAILYHHVTLSTFKPDNVTDGQQLSMVDGTKITIGLKDGKMTVDGHPVLASIPASNGIVHVIDAVLLPPAK